MKVGNMVSNDEFWVAMFAKRNLILGYESFGHL